MKSILIQISMLLAFGGMLCPIMAQPCVEDHVLSGNLNSTPSGQGYRASNTIQSTHVLASGITVNYIAGNSITLQPGFVATEGVTFHAYIEGCNVGIEDLKAGAFGIANYPNPFHDQTRIIWFLEQDAEVSLSIRNTLGQIVAMPIRNQMQSPGEHEIIFEADRLPAGVYYYQLHAGNLNASGSMIIE